MSITSAIPAKETKLKSEKNDWSKGKEIFIWRLIDWKTRYKAISTNQSMYIIRNKAWHWKTLSLYDIKMKMKIRRSWKTRKMIDCMTRLPRTRLSRNIFEVINVNTASYKTFAEVINVEICYQRYLSLVQGFRGMLTLTSTLIPARNRVSRTNTSKYQRWSLTDFASYEIFGWLTTKWNDSWTFPECSRNLPIILILSLNVWLKITE